MSDTQNIVKEVILYVGSFGLPEDMRVLTVSTKECTSSSINSILVGVTLLLIRRFVQSAGGVDEGND